MLEFIVKISNASIVDGVVSTDKFSGRWCPRDNGKACEWLKKQSKNW